MLGTVEDWVHAKGTQYNVNKRGSTMKQLLVVFVVLALAVPMAGMAFAMIPNEDRTIQACYKNHNGEKDNNGQLRVVSDPSNCKNNET